MHYGACHALNLYMLSVNMPAKLIDRFGMYAQYHGYDYDAFRHSGLCLPQSKR